MGPPAKTALFLRENRCSMGSDAYCAIFHDRVFRTRHVSCSAGESPPARQPPPLQHRTGRCMVPAVRGAAPKVTRFLCPSYRCVHAGVVRTHRACGSEPPVSGAFTGRVHGHVRTQEQGCLRGRGGGGNPPASACGTRLRSLHPGRDQPGLSSDVLPQDPS